MSKQEREIKTLTARSLIIGLVLTVIFMITFSYGRMYALNKSIGVWGLWGPREYSTMVALLLPLIAVNRIIPEKYRLNPAEMAFIFSCIVTVPVLSGGCLSGVIKYPSELPHWAVTYGAGGRQEWVLSRISPLLYPTDLEVLKAMKTGVSPSEVPWSAWTVPIVFVTIYWIIMRLFFLFGAAILQNLFIDVEALPFPIQTNVNYELINISTSKDYKKRGILSSKISRILFVIGFLIYFLLYIFNGGRFTPTSYIPGWPYYAPELYVDLTPMHITTSPLCFDFEPTSFAWLMIMPLDVVTSVWISSIIFYQIMAPILVSTGAINDWGEGVGVETAARFYLYTHRNQPKDIEWEGGYSVIRCGMLLAIAIIPLVIHRKRIFASIKTAISGGEGGFIKPRILWAGWGLTAIILIGLYIAVGVPVYYSPILLAVIGIQYLGVARICAASIGYPRLLPHVWEYEGNEVPAYLACTAFGLGMNESAGATNAIFLTFQYHSGAASMNDMSLVYWLEMFKLGQLTNADRRKLPIAMIIGAVIPIIIGVPLGVYLYYTMGGFSPRHMWSTSKALWGAWNLYSNGSEATTNFRYPVETGIYIRYVSGFILICLIEFLRARFATLSSFVSPYGFFLGLVDLGQSLWFPALILTVIRVVVYRVGGTRMYEEKILPIGVGIIVSESLCKILTVVTQVLAGMQYITPP